MNRKLFLVSAACALVAAYAFIAACGSSSPSPGPTPSAFTIAISGFSFSPLNLEVPPGATVTVVNNDSVPHSVTSEATAGSFTPGAVSGVSFNTGVFTGQRSFTIPSSAPDGTVVPYYCAVHTSAMATPTGTITIRASAAPDGGAPDGGAGPDGGAATGP